MALYARLLLLISLLSGSSSGYAQFGFWLNYKGEIKLFSYTGAPYDMAWYQEHDPMARLKMTTQKISDDYVGITDTIDDAGDIAPYLDFYGSLKGGEFFFDYDYPFYSNTNSGFHEKMEKTKGVFEYSSMEMFERRHFGNDYARDLRDIGENMLTSYQTWILDTNYRLSKVIGSQSRGLTVRPSGDTTRPIGDTQALYSYYYNKKNKLDSVVAWDVSDLRSGLGWKHFYTYYFYGKDGMPSFLVTCGHTMHGISASWCANQLASLLHSQDSFINNYDEDNNPDLLYLLAYRYKNKKLSACYQYDLNNGILIKDSITYNSNRLPVCIDQIILGDIRRDTSDDRFIVFYDHNNRVEKTISFSVDHYDKIKSIPLKNQVRDSFPEISESDYNERTYFYDRKGRIFRADEKSDYDNHTDNFRYKKP